jgi:hypothetical protein
MIQEAIRIAKEAAAMDDTHVFALAGSTAIHLYLHELLKHPLTTEDKKEAERLLETLAAPDDLDFKYKRHGPIFAKHIVKRTKPPVATTTTIPTLDLSSFLEESTPDTCQSYVDLAGFRCCDPYEESPIFHKLPETTSAFSKLEFHAPKEFRRKPMETVEISGIPVLSIDNMLDLYGRYEVSGNHPKRVALTFIDRIYNRIKKLK